jgi:mevalonate kinase
MKLVLEEKNYNFRNPKKNMKGPLFYSKILLFGEYGIIKDSKGLSIPYNFYNGALKVDNNLTQESKKSNESLKRFVSYLEELQSNQPELVMFNIETLKQDVERGMYFDSSIPQGYGVGSSGALVAAVYDKYALNKITVLENLTREKLLQLKTIFSEMESFFHGKSSGLDPLNSYLSIPILINSKDNIEATGIPSQSTTGKGAVFLLDSGIVGETAPMVNIFMENLKEEGFRKMLKDQFVKHTDACVENFLHGDIKSLFSNTKKLSKVVLNNFKPMIPEKFHSVWQQGIDTNDYYLKLCGSGGGGYMLGFTQDLEKAKKALKDYKLEVVYQF